MKNAPSERNTNEEYMDASFVLETSVIVESFFSNCGGILTDTQSTLTPYMFQCLASLKANRGL